MADKCIESGNMYAFSGKRRWRKSKDDNWGVETRGQTCGKMVGSRVIDGVRVNVVKTADGRFYAAKPTSTDGGTGGTT